MKSVILSLIVLVFFLVTPGHGEMYKWVDEKGTVHFTDDPSKIPEKYRPDVEERKAPKEIPVAGPKEKPKALAPSPKSPESEGFEVDLVRKHEVFVTEGILNGKIKQQFVVDTGASFTLISRQTAAGLGLIIDENTPFMPISTASDVILAPWVILKSLRLGKAEVENVHTLVYNMPSSNEAGLLGNSFLNKFKVILDAVNGKMTLYPLQGKPSPDRPGGYGKDFWVSQFRFYHWVLGELQRMKGRYEKQGLESARSELNRVNGVIRYVQNQLDEFDRKASFAGVPRNWRE